MNDPIYEGWETRARLLGAVKNKVSSVSLSKNAKKLSPALAEIINELHKLGLDEPAGIARLAGIMAEDILKSFDNVPEEVTTLPFYHHLQKSIYNVFCYEGHFVIPKGIDGSSVSATSELWAMEEALGRVGRFVDELEKLASDLAQMFHWFVTPILEGHPQLLSHHSQGDADLSFNVPLAMVMTNLPQHVERMVQLPFAPEFDELETTRNIRARLEYNVVLASGGVVGDPTSLHKAKLPTKAPSMSANDLIAAYLDGTPFINLFNYSVPIIIPQESRFQHHHIVAGSGHGKTQTLQHLILHDLETVAQGNASIVVLDSQGDLIKNITNLKEFATGGRLADRLVLIDPTDVAYPVALNLFDVGMERINKYSQFDRERMLNGILELYDFVLGSLLGAEMTQKQSVIFRYITRLLLHIPGATIHTLRELLEDGGADKYRANIESLEGSARAFFETEFNSKEFVQTKRQVVRRLWGILENQTFERMFTHPKNKLDLFSEMNSGKVILINTSKDLLKKNGTEIFGRFFIALIAQAAQERAAIDENKRMPTFVYIDEAQDYFDQNIEIILEQARKYKVGMILAHQHLGQLENKLQDAIFGNTAIKFAGGLSSKDARAFASDMRTSSDFIEEQSSLTFAAFIRGVTSTAVSLSVNYGTMEARPKMSDQETSDMRERMRELYAVPFASGSNNRDEDDVNVVLVGNKSVGVNVEVDNLSNPQSDDAHEW